MSANNVNNVLIAHFPRSAMGYAQSAVDEFVRQIGERLEEMQVRLDELTEQNEQLTKQAASAKKEQEQGGQREVALANAMLAIEQRKLVAETEIEGQREQARRELAALREAAQREADGLQASAQREAEGLKETARRESDAMRAAAQSESNQIVGRAKQAAEQIIDEAAAAAAIEEQRLQGLCLQYDNTVDEMRRVLEMQLSLLPAPRTYDLTASAAGHLNSPAFNEAPYDEEFSSQPAFATDGLSTAA